MVHGSDGGVGEDIIEWAANFLAAYRSAQLPRSPYLVHSHDCWQAPGARQVKVNFDVAFIDAEYYLIAVVVRKEDVACLWWRVRRLAGQPSAVVGEACTSLEGVILALEKGWREVILEGDCS